LLKAFEGHLDPVQVVADEQVRQVDPEITGVCTMVAQEVQDAEDNGNT